MIEQTLDIATADGKMETFICRPERGGPFPSRFREQRCLATRQYARIVTLAADGKEPGSLSAAGLAEQIKMVAGEGFEPSTFRL